MPPPRPEARDTPPAAVEGYSGTAFARANSESGETAAPPREAPRQPRGRIIATDEQLPAVAQAIAKAVEYDRILELMYQLGQGWIAIECQDGLPDYPGWKFQTRFQREPDRLAPVLFSAFGQAEGVCRQNIIFQVALALPERICVPWLIRLRAAGDVEDAEDALCALAFRGHQPSMSEFEFLARTPSGEDCRIIADSAYDHDVLATQGRRGLLRSFRCVELLDCKPYYWKHSWAFGRGVGMRFPWADEYAQNSAKARAEIARRLLPRWINRFEGHPGSDDMAWRLCQDCREREQWVEAARWASRCATFPDQDMAQQGVIALTTLAETRLERWQLDQLLDGSDPERNRTLLQYIRLRRAAAHEGFAVALREAAVIAAAERDSQLGHSFASRWSREPARGLDSGIIPLPADDPLRRLTVASGPEVVPGEGALDGRWKIIASPRNKDRSVDPRRKHPSLEAVPMHSDRLARQFRLWETMAELENRRDAARGDERADLEYKLAAVYYHERDVVYPCYATHNANSGLPEGSRTHWQLAEDSDLDGPGRAVEFRLGLASLARAARLFTQLAEDHPNWAGRDKALFSAALAHVKLADYRPFWNLERFDIRVAVALFEQLEREHPQSNLADDAQRAAQHWRRARRDLFQ